MASHTRLTSLQTTMQVGSTPLLRDTLCACEGLSQAPEMALEAHNLTNKDLGSHPHYGAQVSSCHFVCSTTTWLLFPARSCAPTGRCWGLVSAEQPFIHLVQQAPIAQALTPCGYVSSRARWGVGGYIAVYLSTTH